MVDLFYLFFIHLSIYFYLKESECKAYNPRPFCKTYTMDKQPLNTGEQKDMTEFFTDLITKIEEMSPELVSYWEGAKGSLKSYRFARISLTEFINSFAEKYSEKFVRRCYYKQCCFFGKYSFLILIFLRYFLTSQNSYLIAFLFHCCDSGLWACKSDCWRVLYSKVPGGRYEEYLCKYCQTGVDQITTVKEISLLHKRLYCTLLYMLMLFVSVL